jgi:hypothetical protein
LYLCRDEIKMPIAIVSQKLLINLSFFMHT